MTLSTQHPAQRLGFIEWPFRIVSDQRFASVWADRATVKRDLESRLNRLFVVSHSTIQLLWADFGAGKTHALRHLQHLASGRPDRPLYTAYCETPVAVTGFGDLYRQLIKVISDDELRSLAQHRRAVTVSGSATADTLQAIQLLESGDLASSQIARAWFGNERSFPHARDLRSYGISGRIESDERAIEVVASIVRLLSARGSSLLWMIDEYQRTAGLPRAKRDVLGRSLVTLFNECPVGLHLMISSSVAQQAVASALLPPDLSSRATTFPMLALPNMSTDDCERFCRDLFAAFRATGFPESYPFDDAGLRRTVALVAETLAVITPRKLMQAVEQLLLIALDQSSIDLPITAPAVDSLWKARSSAGAEF